MIDPHTILVLLLLAVGFALGYAYGETKRQAAANQYKKETDFMAEEIKRLRKQVADTIGRGPYG